MKALLVRLADWLDDRTGYRQVVHHLLYENIPSGSRWRYVTGSMLVFAFFTQLVTGLVLWMAYSPSRQTAWESVYFIQHEMQGGWLLRGLHHFMAQAMVVLLVLHLLQVVIDKAYQAPREINFWLGLVLMLLVFALGLTGYLLPWDQKAYWATRVATNLMELAPGGKPSQRLVVGGSDYGHHTLTRFFALHAGLIPALLLLVLGLHLAMFRRHGITAKRTPGRPDEFFWPHQVAKDAVACLVLLVVVVLVAVGPGNAIKWLQGAEVSTAQLGAELGPPADPAEQYDAARPEWYYLFLFQLLRIMPSEFIGAIVLPAIVLVYMFAMPLVARLKRGHAVNVAVLGLLILGAIGLTAEAIYNDQYARWFPDPPQSQAARERYESSAHFLAAKEEAEAQYHRTLELIQYYGIPRGGALELVRNDPEIQGPKLFKRYCASCHSYVDEQGRGIVPEKPSAPNLYRFASRQWIAGLLDPDKIRGPHYFGNTAHAEGEMVDQVESLRNITDEEKQHLQNLIIALSAEAGLPYQAELDEQARREGLIEKGIEAFDGLLPTRCADCHYFRDFQDDDSGPTLTGYGSYDWLKRFISNPEHFYQNNDRMPAFAPQPGDAPNNELTQREIDLLVRWIRQEERDLELKRRLMASRTAASASAGADSEDRASSD